MSNQVYSNQIGGTTTVDGVVSVNYNQIKYFPEGLTNIYTTTMTDLTLDPLTDGQKMYFDKVNGVAAIPNYDSLNYLFDAGVSIYDTCEPILVLKVDKSKLLTEWIIRTAGTYHIEGQMVAKIDTSVATDFKLGINLHVGPYLSATPFVMSNKVTCDTSDYFVVLPFCYTRHFEVNDQFHFDYSFTGTVGNTAKLVTNAGFGTTNVSITKL